ncbi:MAG: sigma-54 interaction domain-containing protein [bacterium]
MNNNDRISAFLFCCFVLLSAQPALAQLNGEVIFPESYAYNAGDDTTWAQPEYDDSDWQRVKYGAFPNERWQGIGWFRYVLEVDSTLWHVPLGFFMGNIFGGAELYLDGKLLQRFGKVVTSKEEEEVAYIMWEPIAIYFQPPAGFTDGRSRHLLAIRYSSYFWNSPVWSGQRWPLFWRIDDLEEMKAHRAGRVRNATIHQMLLIGVFLAFALLHLLLYLFYPSQGSRTNLYFAALTASTAVMVYCDFQEFFAFDAVMYFIIFRVFGTAAILVTLSGLRFIYALSYPKRPRSFLLFSLVGIGLTLWFWFRPLVAQTYLIIFYIIGFAEIIRVIAATRITKRSLQLEGGWILLLGSIPFVLVGIYYFLAALEVVQLPWDYEDFPTPYYAVLCLIISMSVFLACNFAQTHKDLEAQSTELAFQVGEKTRTAEALQKALSEVEQLKDRLQAENVYLQDEIKLQHNFGEIICSSEVMKSLLRKVEQVAAADSTVLILGETGTGKELIAHAVHNISGRSSRPLVKVNCAVLPANLIESELFGHEKGAFTGAHSRKIGRFELADGATIFLDEIGDLPLELQTKLLRVLQEGEIERLGSTKTIDIDVRVIAATNRDLENAIENQSFREDLYYRLNVFPIKCPPLRERKEDIPLLVNHFIKKYSAKSGKAIKTITQTAIDRLQTYHWPGNVRELENIIERAVVITHGEKLELGDWLPKAEATSTTSHVPTLEELEREHILEVLELTNWRVSGEKGAARILGIKSTTLDARIKKLGISRKR